MNRPQPNVVDLDEAEAEIRQRWFVWTAAGLAVAPLTWTDQDDATRAARPVEQPDVPTPRSLTLHVARPTAHVDIVLHCTGSTDVAVLRPGSDAVVHTTVQLRSVAAFGQLLDRVVELITWSGVPKSDGPTAVTMVSEATNQWVVGYDGSPWSGAT